MTNNAFIFTTNSMIAVINNKQYTITNTHPRFTEIKAAYREKRYDDIVAMVDIASTIHTFGNGKLVVEGRTVKYNGSPLNKVITARIITMIEEGFDVEPIAKFLDNLAQNPSYRAVNELYTFLEKCELPITEDGHFLAYKRVTSEFLDFHTRTIDNSVGAVVDMPRNAVDDDKENVCSSGLHFCSLPYLKSFHDGEGVVVAVKVNPADVVSIPRDYNFTKGRTCRYEVISVVETPSNDYWDKSVVNSKGEEYTNDGDGDDPLAGLDFGNFGELDKHDDPNNWYDGIHEE